MPRDSRMSRLLHVLIHLDRHVDRATSDQISKMLGTNPVVVRRMMSELRKSDLVTAERGQSGGWRLNKPLSEIKLLDVYTAIGSPPLFNIGPGSDNPQCLVEQAVENRVAATLEKARALIQDQFASLTIEDIAQDFESRLLSENLVPNTGDCDGN